MDNVTGSFTDVRSGCVGTQLEVATLMWIASRPSRSGNGLQCRRVDAREKRGSQTLRDEIRLALT